MYHRILTKPRKWDEESLALATKEELVADLLLRKAQLQNRKKPFLPWERYALKEEMYWIGVVNRELDQRREWTMEG
jgi:hypothetical protein